MTKVETVRQRLWARGVLGGVEATVQGHGVTLEQVLERRRGPDGPTPARRARAALCAYLRSLGVSRRATSVLLGLDRWTVIRDLAAWDEAARGDAVAEILG